MSLVRIRSEFKRLFEETPYDKNNDASSTGTGFFMSIKGIKYIITAHHVVENSVRVSATHNTINGGEPVTLKLLGMNPYLDVAILEVPSEFESANVFKPGSSSLLKSTDRVVAMGFANGDRHIHVTSGTISGRTNWPLNRVQTDTAVNPGNSGGPVTLDTDHMKVVGVVTSGMDDMQSTNHFTGIDEILLVVERIIARRYDSEDGIGRDLGFHLNAVVFPSDRETQLGKPGGAFVSDAMKFTNLKPGDVIREIKVDGTWRELDVNMMISIPEIWKQHPLDFRTALDMMRSSQVEETWFLKVRRAGIVQQVEVNVSSNKMKSRFIFPDCEPLEYFMFGGLVVQNMKENLCNNGYPRLKTPKSILYSFPVVTHILPGSPFRLQDTIPVLGKKIIGLEWSFDNVTRMVKNLDDIKDHLIPHGYESASSTYLIMIFEDGSRVGSSVDRINEFDANITMKEAMRGKHSILLPDWKDVHTPKKIPENEQKIMKNVIHHWKQPMITSETKHLNNKWLSILVSVAALAFMKCKI